MCSDSEGLNGLTEQSEIQYYFGWSLRSIYAIPHPPQGGSSLYQREPFLDRDRDLLVELVVFVIDQLEIIYGEVIEILDLGIDPPTSKPDTCANICSRIAYWQTFQLLATSISCERWLRIIFSLFSVTFSVTL